MADTAKGGGKFDLQKILNDVKSMISPVTIPAANKNDPIGYCLAELSKLAKDLAETHSKQADTIAKLTTMVGTLHQEIGKSVKKTPQEGNEPAAAAQSEAQPQEAAAPADAKEAAPASTTAAAAQTADPKTESKT